MSHQLLGRDQSNKKEISTASLKGGLYHLYIAMNKAESTNKASCSAVTSSTTHDLWYLRLGHLSTPRLALLKDFISLPTMNNIGHCDICPLDKQCRSFFSLSTIKIVRPFAKIHVDICGPYKTLTIDGGSYFITIIDDFSRCTWFT